MIDDIIKQLEFRYELNKFLKRYSFEQLFEREDEFLVKFAVFKQTRIGQIWLRKPLGQAYLQWQGS